MYSGGTVATKQSKTLTYAELGKVLEAEHAHAAAAKVQSVENFAKVD